MSQARRAVNIPDILIGSVLAIVLPIMTLVLLAGSREGAEPQGEGQGPGQPPKPKLPMGVKEVDEVLAELTRMYRDNGKLFLIRSQDAALDPKFQAEEAAWARSTLERCQKGFTELLAQVRASPPTPEYQGRLELIEKQLRSLESDLRSVAAGPPPPATATAPAPETPPAAQSR